MPQTVVVTGASAGVGRAVAREYAHRGADVALLARGEAGLEAAAAEAERQGVRAVAIPLDVADAAAVDAAAQQIERELGPVDVWVNNAMVTVLGRSWDITPGEYARVMEVNYLGFVHGTLAALRHMRPRNHGTIVEVGSALAFRGIPAQSPYCASKHAIQGFTESLRSELLAESSDVRLCAVHLPGLNTPQFEWGRNKLANEPQPVPPIYQPEVAARAITWAADHGRPTTYVAPSTVLTVWGNRLAQPLLARYLARGNIQAQQTDAPRPADAPDNLFRPLDLDVDHGAHGPFDERAHARSSLQVLSRHRGKVAATVGSVALAGWLLTHDGKEHHGGA